VGMSGDSSKRFDIVAETRRVRSDDEKRAIIAEASQGFRNASAVARRHGIKPSLLFRWKKQFASKPVLESPPSPTSFVPVTLALPSPVPGMAASESRLHSMIEIEFAGGRKLRVGPDIEVAVLRRIIAALETP
jgi:transposase